MGKAQGIVAMLALSCMLPGAAMADTRAGVDAWTRAETATAAGDKAGARREYATAIREWQTQADKGDPDAQFNLGQAYKWGKGVPQDLARAEMMFAKAAAKGHTEAADNYGLLLFQRGQHAQAMPYIQAAADRGEKRALYLVGIAHFNGENVPKDWVRAYALETLAAQANPGQPALPQAKAALEQMDRYISLEDRQRGASLASELSPQIDTNRQRQFASADLGNTLAPTAEAPPEAPAHAAPAAPATPATKPKTKPVPVRVAEADAKPGPEHTPRPEPTSKPATGPKPTAAPPKPIPAGNGWKLQLGAFGVPANADALWNKVKGMAEVSGHARINLPTGKVSRLMAGGYSEDGAKAACRKLTAAGMSCLPVRD